MTHTHKVLNQIGGIIYSGTEQQCRDFVTYCQAKGIWEVVEVST